MLSNGPGTYQLFGVGLWANLGVLEGIWKGWVHIKIIEKSKYFIKNFQNK